MPGVSVVLFVTNMHYYPALLNMRYCHVGLHARSECGPSHPRLQDPQPPELAIPAEHAIPWTPGVPLRHTVSIRSAAPLR